MWQLSVATSCNLVCSDEVPLSRPHTRG